MTYYARSASPSAPNQSYPEHIANVLKDALRFWAGAARYWRDGDGTDRLEKLVRSAAAFHDLGKLDDANQKVLSGKNSHAHLPIPHQDAGVAHLVAQNEFLAALLVYAHHIGLPNLVEIQLQEPPLRIEDVPTRTAIDESLLLLLRRHEESGGLAPLASSGVGVQAAIDFRILFSCLTDADHGDAARASGEIGEAPTPPELRAVERLDALKNYVSSFPSATAPEKQRRNALRADFFEACLQSPTDAPLTECDAPVGTGKTTAVMAHLLRVADKHRLRRVLVILPFTNIIRQSVEVYRKALVLPGENPEEVVAEIHHRADFKDKASRQLTALWNAPIIVTTAVAFFETLASNRPATLRRLHNLPGSAVFLDEAHAMLPAKLLPLAWQWINHTARDWTCFWTLASGSLNRFWELPEFALPGPVDDVPAVAVQNILPVAKQAALAQAETVRVNYLRKPEPLSLAALCDWLATLEGPVLVVLNTVHTAASAARLAAERFGLGNVLHLSTSLSPKDRDITLDLVKAKLRYQGHNTWFLFATSCVEAGVDLSFRKGVRECASLASLLQLAGRVNRNAGFHEADVWTISFDTNDPDVATNPAWTISSRILVDFFEHGDVISPLLCTEAMKRELREGGVASELEALVNNEATCAFKTVEEEFRVIPDGTISAVVDMPLIARIEKFEEISWRDIQSNSVQIRRNLAGKLALEESRRYPGVFLWKYGYSSFLGYMEGVLKLTDTEKDCCAII